MLDLIALTAQTERTLEDEGAVSPPSTAHSCRLPCFNSQHVYMMVQVEVKYQPPMTMSTQAAEVTGEAAITVIGGPAHAPSLPAHAVTGRSCFNVGPAAQRMITPTALLTLVDRSVHRLCNQTDVVSNHC